MTTDDNRKVALITGITGQDGSYLAELLLEKGYSVSFVESVAVLHKRSGIDRSELILSAVVNY